MFLREVQELADYTLVAEFRANLEMVTARLDGLRRRIPGAFDEREAILTIEANSYEGMCWGTDLLFRYTEQAERQGRRVQIYSTSESVDFDLSVTMRIGGLDAFGWLKSERALHRLHREGDHPAVDARVEVLAVAVSYDEVHVDEDDVEIIEQRERSSCGGPRPDDVLAVSLRHLSTGTSVRCGGQGATRHNRTGAWTLLRARLLHLRGASDEKTPPPVRHYDSRSPEIT